MEDNKEVVQGEIEQFAGLFEEAGPMSVLLTFEQIAVMLNALKVSGEFMVIAGADQETLDNLIEISMGIKNSCGQAMQTYLDEVGNGNDS